MVGWVIRIESARDFGPADCDGLSCSVGSTISQSTRNAHTQEDNMNKYVGKGNEMYININEELAFGF